MKTYFARIVTWMDYPPLADPQTLLEGGTRTITLGDKVRVFAVRNVFYDDSMTPLYTVPLSLYSEKKYGSVEELKSSANFSSSLLDSPILDWDKSLKTYEPCTTNK